MKTIIEHYQEFPEPYKTQAINNLYPNMANKTIYESWEALVVGFYWEPTPEKFEYWKLFAIKLQMKNK